MKHFPLFLLLAIALIGCSNNGKNELGKISSKQNEATEEHLKNIEGYFAKNNITFKNEWNWKNIVVTNQKDFDAYFGIAKTMTNKIEKNNFEKNYIIAITTKPSNVKKEIILLYSEVNNEELLVQYNVREWSDKNSYKSKELFLTKIPKNIRSVQFKTKTTTETIDIEK